MAILGKTGRRSPGTRLLLVGIVGLLLAGAATMVLPFLVMLSGSVKSGVDGERVTLWPKYLTDDTVLYRKHVEGLFNETLSAMQTAYDTDVRAFGALLPPDQQPEAVADWRAFLADDPPGLEAWTVGYVYTPLTQTDPHLRWRFREELKASYDGDITAVNRALDTEFANWNAFILYAEDFLSRRSLTLTSPFGQRFQAFKQEQDPIWRYHFSVEGFYRQRFLKSRYGGDVAGYNSVHGTHYASMTEVPVPEQVPTTPLAASEWEEFVRQVVNLQWVQVDEEALPDWRAYLRARYASFEAFKQEWGGDGSEWAGALPACPDANTAAFTVWEAWIQGWTDPADARFHQAPLEQLRLRGPAFGFRTWLQAREGGLAALNESWGTDHPHWQDVRPPFAADHYVYFIERKKEIRREFVVRNYRTVLDYLLRQGRGLYNTFVYCGLAVALALLVNPLAAYALSRFRPRATYKLLLIMLLTMAFPPMVTQIPVFLMLRDFGLLNSFWALVLPGMANGYSIFLLKGFFDSLPRELYESAAIDGAGEWTLFWGVTMNLSKPILAVVALAAFTSAYTNFMFALLICQDERMWTLMVWLYQLQQTKGEAVVYASLLVAAVPTLLIFVFCQNIIMRGIVVPAEK